MAKSIATERLTTVEETIESANEGVLPVMVQAIWPKDCLAITINGYD